MHKLFLVFLVYLFFFPSAQLTGRVMAQAVQVGLVDTTITHDGLERAYAIYVPESYTGDQAVPLLFSLHGATGTWESQYEISQFSVIADRENFILITPEATRINNLITFWNNESDTTRANDVGFIRTLIENLTTSYAIDTDRVYCAGSSNGGFMCFQLACALSDKIAAITAVKGTMSERQLTTCNPTRPVPALQLHGTADELVSYDSVDDALDFWSTHNQTNTTPLSIDLPDLDPNDGSTVQYIILHNGINGSTVEHFKVNGGGHDWFGEPGSNQDIDASEEAWTFFSKHDLNGSIETSTSTEQSPDNRGFSLHGAFPNPFKNAVTIEVDTAAGDEAHTVVIYDMLGREVAVLHQGSLPLGASRFRVDTSTWASGIYIVRAESATSNSRHLLVRQ